VVSSEICQRCIAEHAHLASVYYTFYSMLTSDNRLGQVVSKGYGKAVGGCQSSIFLGQMSVEMACPCPCFIFLFDY